MVLTSMSLLGLSFVGTTELWTIHYPRKRVQLIFKDFFVACKNKDGIGSTLKVIESTYERTFCSLSRPPDTIYSVSDLINISFARSEIRIHEVPYTEGFRLIYHVMNTSYEHLIGFETKRIEGKLYVLFVHK
ncbi:uncharacterized protein LOC128557468 [Mercenaria mercenaria]|uniref:uncharacterized protein LOC128557468 n=1 Tax=Mercenaria mercenaria TaxID=6596 RepID=UPI00234F7CBA|nr:uncharacterized protein LOC128557468 [Mercenaria mercenaria]